MLKKALLYFITKSKTSGVGIYRASALLWRRTEYRCIAFSAACTTGSSSA